jgi:hypothetical protein
VKLSILLSNWLAINWSSTFSNTSTLGLLTLQNIPSTLGLITLWKIATIQNHALHVADGFVSHDKIVIKWKPKHTKHWWPKD